MGVGDRKEWEGFVKNIEVNPKYEISTKIGLKPEGVEFNADHQLVLEEMFHIESIVENIRELKNIESVRDFVNQLKEQKELCKGCPHEKGCEAEREKETVAFNAEVVN